MDECSCDRQCVPKQNTICVVLVPQYGVESPAHGVRVPGQVPFVMATFCGTTLMNVEPQ